MRSTQPTPDMTMTNVVPLRAPNGVAFLFIVCVYVLSGLLVPMRLNAAPASLAAGRGSVTGRVLNADTDQYLVGVQVKVEGSNVETSTDETGSFVLSGVPSGPAVLQFYYTGLVPATTQVQVKEGKTVNTMVTLSSRKLAEGLHNNRLVTMDPYTVSADTQMSAEALAINERRFAPNSKNVLAANAFGNISEGNVGEFLKYMPGISADFADPVMASISVRGLPSNLTQVTMDGAQMASAHTGGTNRVFQFHQVTIDNLSRVELIKVPRPADPADSMGGIVNLVTKSAFESKNPEFDYKMYLTGAQGTLTGEKIPDNFKDRRRPVLPSAEFTYTLPLNNRIGFVISGSSENRYDERHVSARAYNATLAQSGASYADPFLQSYILQDSPRYTYRNSLSAKMDWRVTRHSVLTANYQYSGYQSLYGMNQMTVTVGNAAAPLGPGSPLSWGPDYTNGPTGRGALTLDGQNFIINGAMNLGSLKYLFDNGDWKVQADASLSTSYMHFADAANGTFYSTTNQLIGLPGFAGGAYTVDYKGITDDGIGQLQMYDHNGNAVDVRDPNNYRLTGATSVPRNVIDAVRVLQFSLRRRFDHLAIPLAIEAGAFQRVQVRDSRRYSLAYTYNGPDHKSSTSDHSSAYPEDQLYANQDDEYGFMDLPWFSESKAYSAWQNDPLLFTQTLAQQVASAKYQINQSRYIKETVNAWYAEIEARFFHDKLRVLAGVRHEKTVGEGEGPLSLPSGVWETNPDGSFVHDSHGNQVRKPEAGAKGSLEEVSQTLFERAARSDRGYDGYYPSVHITYNITSNFLARAEYAKTYGRPDFGNIIPAPTITDYDLEGNTDPTALKGTINAPNPSLRPWVANNYDFSLEYYTNTGGVLSVDYYYKQIDGFFQNVTSIATAQDLTALGLDPATYLGYQITTTYNLNPGEVHGYEYGIRQPLKILGAWAAPFMAFANASFSQQITGNHIQSYNVGLTYRHDPITIGIKGNYRSAYRQQAVTALGPDAYEYEGARTIWSISVAYTLSKHVTLFVSSNNVLNNKPTADRYGSMTPEYAQRFRIQNYGAQYQLGIQGTF